MRNVRLGKAAACLDGGSLVLDLACGEGYLSSFLPEGCEYYGVDRLIPPESGAFTDFLALDVLEEDAFERIREWLPREPDYLTCVAFLEHIGDPAHFARRFAALLPSHGKLVGTTPHPMGRKVHDSLASLYLCSRQGAAEHEEFLGRRELERLASVSGGVLVTYERFLFGLNQLFVIEYPGTRAAKDR